MSTESFWSGVAAYNRATWPVQVVLFAAFAYLIYRLIARPGRATDRWIKVYFVLAFFWDAIAFFMVFGRNPIALFVGMPLFVVVALLFAIDARRGHTAFRLPEAPGRRAILFGWLALAALYPVIGWVFLGHAYPTMLFPMMPCPLTVLAIALVSSAAPRIDRWTLLALLPWALLGLPKCLGALDCYEDCILFAAGVYGTVVLARQWRASRHTTRAGAAAASQAGEA